MTKKHEPFNPLDVKNLGTSVAEALLAQTAEPFTGLTRFGGAGVYAIYYTGGFRPYHLLAQANSGRDFACPIYVGKAVPAGARKGVAVATSSIELFKRLTEHKKSIEAAANLDVADFHYRCLLVDSIWIPLGESLLIARFAPVWNSICDGFGNHDPGKGRYSGKRSRWDVLHPGRPWVDNLAPRVEPASVIEQDIEEYLRQRI